MLLNHQIYENKFFIFVSVVLFNSVICFFEKFCIFVEILYLMDIVLDYFFSSLKKVHFLLFEYILKSWFKVFVLKVPYLGFLQGQFIFTALFWGLCMCVGASLLAQLDRIHLKWGRPGFDPWVGKIPWRRDLLPTPVSWPGEFHRLYSLWGHKESDRTEPLSLP